MTFTIPSSLVKPNPIRQRPTRTNDDMLEWYFDFADGRIPKYFPWEKCFKGYETFESSCRSIEKILGMDLIFREEIRRLKERVGKCEVARADRIAAFALITVLPAAIAFFMCLLFS